VAADDVQTVSEGWENRTLPAPATAVPVERQVPDARFAVGDEVAMHSAVSGAVAEDQVDLVIGQPLRKWAEQRSRKGRTSLGGSCTAGHHNISTA
jgi:hypothetical protein